MESRFFKRDILSRLRFIPGLPVLIVVGARRVGKTTLLQSWYDTFESTPRAWLDGDNPAHLLLWERLRSGQDGGSWLTSLTGNNGTERTLLFLDEAQMLPDSSRLVKVLVDALPELRVVMSGSSALKLKDLSSESLAGRKQLLELYPLNLHERLSDPRLTIRVDAARAFSLDGLLGDLLVWGGFPGVTALPQTRDKISYLTDVVDSLLYRDLMSEVRVKDVGLLKRMLSALARAVGSQISVSKLGAELELSRPTITRYLDLFEEASLIRLLPGIGKSGIVPKAHPKIYFLDNGILSWLMLDTRVFETRKPEDQALLLENYLVGELVKYQSYQGDTLTQLGYLWHPKGEIDLVTYRNGAIQRAIEIKLSDSQGGSRETRAELGQVGLEVVNLGNISDFFIDLWKSIEELNQNNN